MVGRGQGELHTGAEILLGQGLAPPTLIDRHLINTGQQWHGGNP